MRRWPDTMKRMKIVFVTAGAAVAVLAIVVAVIIAHVLFDFYPAGPINDLGLYRSDMAAGGASDIEALRTTTKTIADSYLEHHQASLTEICGGPFVISVAYALTPTVHALGYHSSFYYFCWDIYLPYTLVTESGNRFIVIVQLSDSTEGNKHDPTKFRVLRSMVVDEKGQTIKTIEG